MTPDDISLAFLIFFLATLYSSVGHAGASGYLAAMALFGLAPQDMRPAALALNILVASLGTWRYVRAGQQDWRLLAPFAAASIPTAFIGGLIHVQPGLYRPLLGFVLLVSALHFARTAREAISQDARTRAPPLAIALAAGGVIGLLSGLTGTGGGIFLSPLILTMGWATTRRTSGVASAFILANSIAGLAGTQFSIGALPGALPLWAATALLGAILGTRLGTRTLPIPGLRYALALVLVIAAAKMVFA
ncbi:MAG: sulfite exporter TauE/SafE family protein [Pseudomonadota bacterium]